MKFDTYPQTIAEGAKLLDQVKPNWFRAINLNALNMKNSLSCILGQVFGDYFAGRNRLFTCKHPISSKEPVFGDYADVERWKEEINVRLYPKAPSDDNVVVSRDLLKAVQLMLKKDCPNEATLIILDHILK